MPPQFHHIHREKKETLIESPGESSEIKGESTIMEIIRLEATKAVVHMNTIKGNLQPKNVPRRVTDNALNKNQRKEDITKKIVHQATVHKEINHTVDVENRNSVQETPEDIVHDKQVTKVISNGQTSQNEDQDEKQLWKPNKDYKLDYSDEENLMTKIKWADDKCEEFRPN